MPGHTKRSFTSSASCHHQDHNRGGAGGEAPLENFSPLLEKCVGRSLKLLDIVQKIWAPLRKLFARPGVPSWLRAWSSPRTYILQDQ